MLGKHGVEAKNIMQNLLWVGGGRNIMQNLLWGQQKYYAEIIMK